MAKKSKESPLSKRALRDWFTKETTKRSALITDLGSLLKQKREVESTIVALQEQKVLLDVQITKTQKKIDRIRPEAKVLVGK